MHCAVAKGYAIRSWSQRLFWGMKDICGQYRRCAEEYMSVASFNIRAAVARDAAACAATAYAAHARVSAVHNFPPELPTLEVATRFIRSKLENPRCRGYVAEKDGYVVGSVFVTAVDDCRPVRSAPSPLNPPMKGVWARP